MRDWLSLRLDFRRGPGSSVGKSFAQVRHNDAHFGAFRGSLKGAPNCANFWRTSAKIATHRSAPHRRKSIGISWPVGCKTAEGARGRQTNTPGQDRTADLRFRKPLLYPLSYGRG